MYSIDHIRNRINYALIDDAIKHYEKLGFKYIEVPWIASDAAVRTTFSGKSRYVCELGHLIGSAEQSLIQMYLEGRLKEKTLYVAATPCFRDEPPDATHFTSFFKVELIVFGTNKTDIFVQQARQTMLGLGLQTYQIPTEQGIDLYSGELEVGSYGFRNLDFCWTYGTGIAEPRFSTALNKR